MPHTLGAPMKCCVVAIGIDRYRASLALRFCLWYPATALARLADHGPIDGVWNSKAVWGLDPEAGIE
jgi:hypothetical protein